MIGAIIGDIVGSRFEWHNIKTKEFDLFAHGCRFTDDTVMSLAVCDALQFAFLLGGQNDVDGMFHGSIPPSLIIPVPSRGGKRYWALIPASSWWRWRSAGRRATFALPLQTAFRQP